MIGVLLALTLQTTPVLKIEDVCKAYNNWREGVYERKQDILNDRIPYLSWNDFVVQKRGEELIKLPSPCGNYRFLKSE